MKMNSLVKEIKEWARITDFHQPFIITHKLYLKKQFGKKIKKQILILETGSKAALGQRLEKEFLSLLKQAGRLDEMCRTGCQTEEELNTFEFVQKRVREKAVEVAQILKAVEKRDPSAEINNRSFEPDAPCSGR